MISSGVLLMAILAGLILAGIGAGFVAVIRAKGMAQVAEKRAKDSVQRCESAIQACQERLQSLATQLQEVQQHPSVTVLPGAPKPGLNLTKRSQALRMYRRGDAADQIAAALEIPRQEVDLLLKVQRIVISNL